MATKGPVRVIGSGLLGASIGLGLSRAGIAVQLEDASPAARALARDVGAGTLLDATTNEPPTLVVVAVPPDVTADVVIAALKAHPDAVVTDVASVKSIVRHELGQAVENHSLDRRDLDRYVGGHPMAGRERSGASAADPDLFSGRPWVVTPEGAQPSAVLAVRNLAVDLGATPITMGVLEHDEAVALVSHLPQVLASLVAARLVDANDGALALAGQGLRDVTRIAASDPRLWAAILVGNAGPVATQLAEVRDDLDVLVTALETARIQGPLATGVIAASSQAISRGNVGVSRIPGKHGGVRRSYEEVTVLVPDSPGELGRLFASVGDLGVNIEDFAMEHAPAQKVGLAMLSVLPESVEALEEGLGALGWRVVIA